MKVDSTNTQLARRPRLKDVAALANVSFPVVSRVLRGDPTMMTRPETRDRIFAAAKELGYTPNIQARGLKTARTMTIGILLPNLAYAVNAEILRGAERRAAAAGYVLLVADSGEFEASDHAFRQLVLEGRVDGLLLASAQAGEEHLAQLSQQTLPLVFVNRRHAGDLVSVSVNDERASRLAVEHLAELGHRRIAHVGGPVDADTAQRRLAGFRAGMKAANLPVTKRLVAAAPFSERGGYEAMRNLLASGRTTPTAVTCSSFAGAVGAMTAIREAGLRVPQDISVVGFHDAEIARYLYPPLTTVRLPLGQMAERAVEVLLGLIEGTPQSSCVVEDEVMLVPRSSTAPPAV